MKLSGLSREEVQNVLLYDGSDPQIEQQLQEQDQLNIAREQIKKDQNHNILDGKQLISRYGIGLENSGKRRHFQNARLHTYLNILYKYTIISHYYNKTFSIKYFHQLFKYYCESFNCF